MLPDEVETDRFGRRAEPEAAEGPLEPVAFFTPEGQRLWARLQSEPPMVAVTSEEFAELVAAREKATGDDRGGGGGLTGSDAGEPSDSPPVDVDEPAPQDQADAAAAGPADRPPWPPGPVQGDRRLAAWRLSGRGSLDAPADD